jgi:hypothetical protein
MADITKCPGGSCPLKEECYRYWAPDGFRQSYFMQMPILQDNDCLHYWKKDNPNKTEDKNT